MAQRLRQVGVGGVIVVGGGVWMSCDKIGESGYTES
jgi:hypothetical protein